MTTAITTTCQEWLKSPLVNPRTKRIISNTGPVYKQLEKECNSSIANICNKWLQNKLINPRTGRIIKQHGPVYKSLSKECITGSITIPTRQSQTSSTIIGGIRRAAPIILGPVRGPTDRQTRAGATGQAGEDGWDGPPGDDGPEGRRGPTGAREKQDGRAPAQEL